MRSVVGWRCLVIAGSYEAYLPYSLQIGRDRCSRSHRIIEMNTIKLH